jgi:hypothetical protein
MADEWLTVKQAAEISGYHPVYLRYLIRTGKVEAQKFATVWQVSRASLKAFLKNAEKQGEKRGPKTGA